MPDTLPDPASDSDAPSAPDDPRAARPFAWTASTYFAEGFPYTVVNSLPEVLFKEMGATLETIGLTSLFHLPWNLKFLWGPFLDRYGTKRKWLLGLEAAIVVALAALTVAATGTSVLAAASVVFLLLAVLSATHDIAIDGFYLEALDEKQQSQFVGTRAMAYRVAMIAVSGPALIVISRAGWPAGLAAITAVMFALLAWHTRYLPRTEIEQRPISELARSLVTLRTLVLLGGAVATWLLARAFADSSIAAALFAPLAPIYHSISPAGWIGLLLLGVLLAVLATLPRIRRRLDGSSHFYAEAFVNFLDQDRIGAILAFVILFRAGESFLLKMRYPFLRDVGITMEQYGVASGTFGVVASITATMLAGYLISRHGLRRWIWPFVLGQNLLNLLYAGLAWHYAPLLADPVTGAVGATADIAVVTAVIVAESFGSGLGTAVFMVYLMRCCRPGYRAAHMAIVTALMSVSFTLAGVASGFMAGTFGFANYFAFTFVATVPAMAIIFMLPNLDEAESA